MFLFFVFLVLFWLAVSFGGAHLAEKKILLTAPRENNIEIVLKGNKLFKFIVGSEIKDVDESYNVTAASNGGRQEEWWKVIFPLLSGYEYIGIPPFYSIYREKGQPVDFSLGRKDRNVVVAGKNGEPILTKDKFRIKSVSMHYQLDIKNIYYSIFGAEEEAGNEEKEISTMIKKVEETIDGMIVSATEDFLGEQEADWLISQPKDLSGFIMNMLKKNGQGGKSVAEVILESYGHELVYLQTEQVGLYEEDAKTLNGPSKEKIDGETNVIKEGFAKKTAIIKAEGVKAAAILEAEGKKKAAIIASEGDLKSSENRAEAERKTIKMLSQEFGPEGALAAFQTMALTVSSLTVGLRSDHIHGIGKEGLTKLVGAGSDQTDDSKKEPK